MKKRIIALLLCFAMMFTMTAYAAPTEGEPGVTVYYNGNPQTSVILPHGNEIRLNAEPNSGWGGTYQWQLNIAGDLWVDVTDANGGELRVSYGMVANLLQNDTTLIRVKMTSGETEVYSDPVTITVSYADSYGAAFIPEDGTVQSNGAVTALSVEDDTVYFSEAYALPPAETPAVAQPTPEVTVAPTVTPEVTVEPTVTPEVSEEPAASPEVSEEPAAASEDTVVPTPTPVPAETESDALIQSGVGTVTYMNADTEAEAVPVADETPGKVSIIINYTFSGGNKDGETAANPWTATVPANEPFAQTVVSPVIRGYQASVAQVELDYLATEMYAGAVKSVTVLYTPDIAPYTVIHYWQNVDNDNYVEHTRFTVNSQKTDDVVDAQYVEATYSGFYPLAYEKPQIASDGSTVIEVYYDRYYYLMSFSLDGGYGVDPQYARYNAPVSEVPDPTKPGWTFMGWLDDDDTSGTLLQFEDLPTTMPAKNKHYTAVWGDPQTVNYTVVYWRENADDTNYSIWGSEVMQAVAGSIVSGSDSVPEAISVTTVDGDEVDEKPYFTYNDALTEKNIVVNGDGSTVVHVYYTRNYYTIYFSGISGTCALEEHDHDDGDCNRPLICHVHDDTCEATLTCTTPEHTHTDACCPNAHTHSDACCDYVHVHTTSCYNNVNTTNDPQDRDLVNAPNNPVDGQIYRRGYGYNRLIYISGTWYRYSENNVNSGTVVSPNNNCPGDHVHGDANCECDLAEHDHTDGTCVCSLGLSEHKHTDACYHYSCEDTMHEHTDACYRDCILYEHAHTTGNPNCSSNSTNNVIYVVHAKYNANISDVWPTAANFPDITFRGWSIDGIDSTLVSKRVNMTTDLCDTVDGVLEAEAMTGGSTTYLYYMFESFDQTSAANGNERILRNGIYYDKSEEYYQVVNSNSNWNQKEIMGMSPVSNGVVTSGSNVFLYYTRNRHTITFQNYGGTTVRTVTNVMYGQPLAAYPDADNLLSDTTAPYPTTLEDGIYVFDGWYTTPEGYAGTKFDFNTATMPDNDLVLYAKWVPITHTVKFYLSRTSMEDDLTVAEELEQGDDPDYHSHPDRIVSHNTILGEIPSPGASEDDTDHPYKGYTFDGWFYVDSSGVERAFLPDSMPVTENLQLYAKWSSNVLRPYNVHFVLDADGDGKADVVNGDYVYVADSITGSALAGNTRTFDAKGGTDLYAGYQEGYFPTEESHSITVDISDEIGNGVNTYLFIYQPKPAVPYTVKYLEQGTNAVLHAEKTVGDNRQAVVTENFEVIQGYMPDAYQKKLVVSSAEDAENVIIFYYTKDTLHAYYKISHYIQQSDGTFTEYTGSEIVGDIGTNYSAVDMSITGYSFSPELTQKYNLTDKVNASVGTPLPADVTVTQVTDGTANYKVEGVLGETGLELNLYYVANYYPYEIRYLEASTGAELHEPKTGAAAYDALINETALRFGVDMNNDGLITDDELIYRVDQNTKLMHVKVEDTVYTEAETKEEGFTVERDVAGVNIITFWYTRESGNLRVSKTVEDKSADQSAPTAPFEFTLVLNYRLFNASSYTYVKYEKDANGVEQPVESGYLPVEEDGITINFTLTDGQSILIKGLPTAAYSVYETVPEDFKSSSPNGVTFDLKNTHTEDAPATIDFTNEYPVKTGDLILKKTVEFAYANDAANFSDTFTFQVDFIAEAANKEYSIMVDGETEARIITADANGTLVIENVPASKNVTILNVPVGAYTVTETASSYGLADNYLTTYYVTYNSDGEPSSAGSIDYAETPDGTLTAHGTIVAGYSVSVDFTNKYDRHLGDLQINKTVSYAYAQEVFAGDTFTFTVAGAAVNTVYTVEITDAAGNVVSTTAKSEANGKIAINLAVPADGKGDYSILIRDLPLGTYTVTESMAAPEEYTTTPASLAVTTRVNGDGNTAQADFVNEVKRSTGNLQVSKEIRIDPTAENVSLTDAMKNLDFEFIIDFKGDETLSGSYACTVTDINGNVVDGAPTELTVLDAVTITNSQGVQETYHNVLYITLKHEQQVVIEGLYIGEYTVREIAKAGYDSSYEEMEGTRDTLEPVQIQKNQTATASCINGFPFYYGDLNVVKEVEQLGRLDTLPADHEFHFNIKLSNFDIGIDLNAEFDYVKYDTNNTADLTDDVEIEKGTIELINHEFNFTLKDNQRILIEQINVCDYVITETADSGVLDHYNTEIEIDKVEGNIDTEGGVQTADVNNDARVATGRLAANDVDTVTYKNIYKKHLNELTIRKTGAAPIDENQSFVFNVTGYTNGLDCEPETDGDEISLRVVITIPAGATDGEVTLSNLPLGTYTIEEEGDWSWRYSRKTVNYTLTDADDQVVTINNTRNVNRWLNGAYASKNRFTNSAVR